MLYLGPGWVVRGTDQISGLSVTYLGLGWVVRVTDQISWSLSTVFGPWLSGYRHLPNILVSQWHIWALIEWLEALTKYLGLWVQYLGPDWVDIGIDQISWPLSDVSGSWLSGNIGTDQISWSISAVSGPWLSGYRHWPNIFISQWCIWALAGWLEAMTKYLGLSVLYLGPCSVVIGTDEISWSLSTVSGPWLSG